MKKLIQIIEKLNIIFIGMVGMIFMVGSGFTILGLLTNGIFQMIFGGFLVAMIFGILSFKNNYFLVLSLIGWIIFAVAANNDRKETKNNYRPADIYFAEDRAGEYLKTHNFCKTTLDCVPVITSCGSCSDYESVINEKYKTKFMNMLSDKCNGKERVCDAMPTIPNKKKVECVNKKCLLVDKI